MESIREELQGLELSSGFGTGIGTMGTHIGLAVESPSLRKTRIVFFRVRIFNKTLIEYLAPAEEVFDFGSTVPEYEDEDDWMDEEF